MNHGMTQTNLLVIRHGQTDWNLERRCQGQSGGSLNQVGIMQAAAAGREVKEMGLEIEVIYTSDLARTMETAQIISDIVGVPVHSDKRLRELAQGDWEGTLYRNFEMEYKRFLEDPVAYPPPGGETLPEMVRRVVTAFNEMAARHYRLGGRAVVVSHELPIAVAACALERRPLYEWPLFAPENGKVLQVAWPATKPLAIDAKLERRYEAPAGIQSFATSEERQRYRRRRRRMARLRMARSMRICALFSSVSVGQ